MNGFVTSQNLLDRYKDFREQNDSRYIRLKNSSSSSTSGGIITLGDGLEINGDTLNVTSTSGGISYGGGSSYSLQPATTSKLGGIIVGGGLEIEDDGTLNVMLTGGSGSTYSVFTGASSTSNGKRGLVPAPSIGDQKKFLCGNGKWETVSGSTTINGGESNIIEAISIDGKTQSIVGKTAILGLSAYAKKSEVGSGVRMKGSVNYFSSLPENALAGDLYNIKYANTGDVDGNGVPIKDGDNVVFTTEGKWDVMAGFMDLSNYVTKDGNKVLSTNDFTTADKNKLNGLQNYTLPTASETELGGIMIGEGLSMAGDTLNVKVTDFFIGANDTEDGTIGFVPPPHIGDKGKFLRGDGYWASIPTENINLIVGGSGSGAVILDAFSYPPNKQGALWMDVVQGGYCLKLRSGDYEYIFKPTTRSDTEIDPPPPSSEVTGNIYYLGTVPSEVNGGLWYSLDKTTGHPTLWVHREGTAYSYDFGFTHSLVAYKGTQTDLYSQLPFSLSVFDLMNNKWTTDIQSPVIEKTDFAIYALRNIDDHTGDTAVNYVSGWRLTMSLSKFTIDFWLSWNAVHSEDSTPVFTQGDTCSKILDIYGQTSTTGSTVSWGSTNSKAVAAGSFGIKNTGLFFGSETILEGTESLLETNEAKRIHIAIVHKYSKGATLYINGKSVKTSSSFGSLSALRLFPYCVGSKVQVRGLYIDHFRIWQKVVWESDFDPPKPEDYI